MGIGVLIACTVDVARRILANLLANDPPVSALVFFPLPTVIRMQIGFGPDVGNTSRCLALGFRGGFIRGLVGNNVWVGNGGCI